MRRPLLITLFVVVLILAFAAFSVLIGSCERQEPQVKWRTHYETVTVDRTVPGPERTVFKKRPSEAVTTWIIVCGENTQRVEGSEAKPITECNLPDTGGE